MGVDVTLTFPAPAVATAIESSAREPQVPFPARFWWLKRLALLGLLLVGLIAAVRAAWGWEAERRFDRVLAPVRAAGWPVRGEELNPPAVADAANGAYYLLRATKIAEVDAVSPTIVGISYPGDPAFGTPWEKAAEQSLIASGAAFPLARQARAHDRFNWGTVMKRPGLNTPLWHLNNTRQLANVLSDAALYAHVHGDDTTALETIRDVMHLSKATSSEPFVICHLVGIGIDSLAQYRLKMIAAGLTIAPEDGPPPVQPSALPGSSPPAGPYPSLKPAARPARRAQVRALIAELLDEGEITAALPRALAGWRAMELDMADWMGGSVSLLRPMFRLDATRMLEHDAALMVAAAHRTLPEAKAVLAQAALKRPRPPIPPPGAMLTLPFGAPTPKRVSIDYARALSSNFSSNGFASDRVIHNHMSALADRRMSAASLAAQLYRADHGQWPGALEALVPAYLPEVPRDPMAAGETRLGYILAKVPYPGGGDRPVVYSVGDNGVNDTPDATGLPNAPTFGGWTRGRDEYRDVSRWAPPTPQTRPTTPQTTTGNSLP